MLRTMRQEALRPIRNSAGTLYEKYFIPHEGPVTSPLEHLALYSLGFMILVAFVTAGISAIVAGYSLMIGFGLFIFFNVLHISLWLTGLVYRLGVFDFILSSIFIVGGVSLLIVVGGLALYGWAVPLFFLVMLYSGFVPEPFASWMMPFFIVFILVFAIVWYSKGLSYFEGF